jgi:hypothetical protein
MKLRNPQAPSQLASDTALMTNDLRLLVMLTVQRFEPGGAV